VSWCASSSMACSSAPTRRSRDLACRQVVRSAEPTYSVYGWSVTMHRTAMEFSELLGVSPAGFQLTGSGSSDVLTAPWYKPGQLYKVTIKSSSPTTQLVRADGSDRLSISVPLGPANSAQQYTAAAALTGTRFTERQLRSTGKQQPQCVKWSELSVFVAHARPGASQRRSLWAP
jgi:hypothetical protein